MFKIAAIYLPSRTGAENLVNENNIEHLWRGKTHKEIADCSLFSELQGQNHSRSAAMGKNRRIKRKNKYEKKTALKNSLQKHLDKKVGQLQDQVTIYNI